MNTAKFKVESGIQLLARLRNKPQPENFYSALFRNGLKLDNLVEIFFAEGSTTTFLLMDILSDAVLPIKFGGIEAGVLIFNTDGNMNFEILIQLIKQKIMRVSPECTSKETDTLLHNTLANLSVVNIYDATQFYTTIQNLESIISEKNISLIAFDTLTAFYWSEQGFKITKMDLYLKTLIAMIRKTTKDYQVTILYTRPEYFNSNKESIENLEVCNENTVQEIPNYRVHVVRENKDTYSVCVKTCNGLYTKSYRVHNDGITWL